MNRIELAKMFVENGGKPILCETEDGKAKITGIDFEKLLLLPFIDDAGHHYQTAEPITEKCPFNKGDIVLVRSNASDNWRIDVFQELKVGLPYPYICEYDAWKQCVLYKGNEKLHVTNDKAV